MRAVALIVAAVALVVAVAGCGGSGGGGVTAPAPPPGAVRHHEPGQGWTADVPSTWSDVAEGPVFVRGEPLADPTRLVIQAYPGRSPAAALHALTAERGISVASRGTAVSGDHVRWTRYRGRTSGGRALAVELAVAPDGDGAAAVALVARRAEMAGLVRRVLLPALDSFTPGPPDPPRSLLATAAADPAYWPTAGWRTASPASQGMDGARLDAMVAEIRAARLPIDSVTVIRHGYVVADASFGRFAAGTLGEPYASGRLHGLQSATKSVTSMLLGIALRDQGAAGMTVETPVVALADAVGYVPAHLDARKRAMTIQDLLTMRAGIAWTESGRAYAPGSGNDVVAMLGTDDWARFVLDRPMAAQPGTTFVYNTGAAHLVAAAATLLAQRPLDEMAAASLFGPLGIARTRWARSPEGISAGGFGLMLAPGDLAKLAFLYLHGGRWDGREVVPAAWVATSTTDQVPDPPHDYGYLWWLDRADGYAFMAGLNGQLAVVDPGRDLVVVVTGHIPPEEDASAVTRWLVERYVLPAAG